MIDSTSSKYPGSGILTFTKMMDTSITGIWTSEDERVNNPQPMNIPHNNVR